jgi:hypothetical protein
MLREKINQSFNCQQVSKDLTGRKTIKKKALVQSKDGDRSINQQKDGIH